MDLADAPVVGRIVKTFGRRGEVVVEPETDFPETRFQAGGELWNRGSTSPRLLVIETARLHQGRPILGFRGVDTIGDAEQLVGSELVIPDAALSPLPPDEYYHHDLIGCTVRLQSGDRIGTVTAVEGSKAAARLVLAGRKGEVQIPLVAGICTSIDVRQKLIVIDPPEGLLDVNE